MTTFMARPCLWLLSALVCGASTTATLAQGPGSAVAWGYSDAVPAPNADFIALAPGGDHTLGLKTEGSLVAWGDNWWGQCDVPTPNAIFVALAAATGHSLGLKADGSIMAWGSNDADQCAVPSPNTGFVSIAAAGFVITTEFHLHLAIGHSLGLRTDGSISAWGNNADGQCDVPAPNSGFVAIAAGEYAPWTGGACIDGCSTGRSLGLRGADGSIVTWGDSSFGQDEVPAPNAGFLAIAAGQLHSLGLKADGSIIAWGDNSFGQCNVPAPNTGFVALAGGWLHSLGLKADGTIVAWGNNTIGQCNVPTPNSGFVAIAARGETSFGLKARSGDLNCDNSINMSDVPHFVEAMLATGNFTGCDINLADMNQDGLIDGRDTTQFADALTAP